MKATLPNSRSLLIENILQLDSEDLPVLVELLRAYLRHRVAGLQRELLERLFVGLRVEQLHHGTVSLVHQPHEYFFPEPVFYDMNLYIVKMF